MPIVDFKEVSTEGLESSPVAVALAGLRANEARYYKNKYDHDFTVEPAGEAADVVAWVHRILEEERDIVIASKPLEATMCAPSAASPTSRRSPSAARPGARSSPRAIGCWCATSAAAPPTSR